MKSHKVFSLIFFSLLIAALGTTLTIASRVEALTISNRLPQSNFSDPPGAHLFNIRKKDIGVAKDLLLNVYIPKTTSTVWNDPNQSYFQLSTDGEDIKNTGGDVCEAINGSSADFIQVFTKLVSTDKNSTVEEVFNISRDNVCATKNGRNANSTKPSVAVNNVFYAKYPVPSLSSLNGAYAQPNSYVDPATDKIKLEVRIKYGPGSNGGESGHVMFKFVSDAIVNSKVSQGAQSLSFPILGKEDETRPDTSILIPFGLCVPNNTQSSQRIRFYDADTGPGGFPRDAKFRVLQTYDYETDYTYPVNARPPMSLSYDPDKAGSNGLISNNTVFTPNPGSGSEASAMVTIDNFDGYVLEVTDLDAHNAVDFSIPGESIFGEPGNCKHWDIEGESTCGPMQSQNQTRNCTVDPGDTVWFRHELRNIERDKTDPFDYSVRWTVNPAGASIIATGKDKTIGGNGAIPPTQTNDLLQKFVVPNNAEPGTLYCQDVAWNPDHDNAPASNDNSRPDSCVTVRITPGASKVKIETIVCIDNMNNCGPDKEIEAGTSHNIRTFVEITNFPDHRDGYQTYVIWSGVNEPAGCGFGNRNNNAPGDNKCYVPARFDIACDTGSGTPTVTPVLNSTVSGTKYCDSGWSAMPASTQDIGSKFCTSLNASLSTVGSDYKNGWYQSPNLYTQPPGNRFIEPGQRFNHDNLNQTRITTWGFNFVNNSNCVRTYGTPYFKVYGGDVRVGSTIARKDECNLGISSKYSVIYGWSRGVGGNFTGASAQHAAFALGAIDQFVSGKVSGLAAQLNNPKSLSFANTITTGEYAIYGGGFDVPGSQPCASFEHVTQAVTTLREINGTTLTAPTSSTNGITGAVTDYASGDVYIRSNITYSGTSWASASAIPSYTLIVKNGNIYIDPSVTQLDGVFIAIPDGVTNGAIYTCASGSPPAPVRQTFNACKNRRLVVNGALIAKQVHLGRDCGSALRGNVNESTEYTAPASPNTQRCSASGANVTVNGAAEIVNFSPESWIPSASRVKTKRYDTITSLPPVL